MSLFGNILRSITGGTKKGSSPIPYGTFVGTPLGGSLPTQIAQDPSLLNASSIDKVMEKKPINIDSIVETIGNIADAGTKVFTAINVSKGNNQPIVNPNSMSGPFNTNGEMELDEVVITPQEDLLSNAKKKINSILKGEPLATVGTEISVSNETKSLIFIVLAVLGGLIVLPKLLKTK